jgi:hypothetical protein
MTVGSLTLASPKMKRHGHKLTLGGILSCSVKTALERNTPLQ